jgi:hypothetical protein
MRLYDGCNENNWQGIMHKFNILFVLKELSSNKKGKGVLYDGTYHFPNVYILCRIIYFIYTLYKNKMYQFQ